MQLQLNQNWGLKRQSRIYNCEGTVYSKIENRLHVLPEISPRPCCEQYDVEMFLFFHCVQVCIYSQSFRPALSHVKAPHP